MAIVRTPNLCSSRSCSWAISEPPDCGQLLPARCRRCGPDGGGRSVPAFQRCCFLGALALTARANEKRGQARRRLIVLRSCYGCTTLVIIYATFDKPRFGDPEAPVQTARCARGISIRRARLIDIPNVVTAVLGSFRGYDTLGEVFVVLDSWESVCCFCWARERAQVAGQGASPGSIGLPAPSHSQASSAGCSMPVHSCFSGSTCSSTASTVRVVASRPERSSLPRVILSCLAGG